MPSLGKSIPLILDNERHYISTKTNRLKAWAVPALVAILIVVNAVVLTRFSDTSKALVEQRSMTVKTKNELQGASQRLERLEDEKTTIDSSLRSERLKSAKKDKEIKSLKVSLQAKKAAQAKLASAQVASKPTQAAPVAKVSGNKASWLAASGIPESQWGAVDAIVTRESGWNPNAVNASSGACGLGQQLPCGKWAGAWNDPVAALKAMNGYVHGRYGGWNQAQAFWNANHYY